MNDTQTNRDGQASSQELAAVPFEDPGPRRARSAAVRLRRSLA